MKKKLIIISISIIVIILINTFLIKGKVTIKPTPKSESIITVDKKIYKNKESLSVRLYFGNHTIKIEKNNYEPYEEKFSLKPMSKKEIKPEMELTEQKDKREIEKTSKEFVAKWYTYKLQTDKEYLEKIKPYMTVDFYEGTYYTNTKRPQDFKGQLPLQTIALNASIISYDKTVAEVKILRESEETTTGKKYQKEVLISLSKNNGRWLVSYLNPVI